MVYATQHKHPTSQLSGQRASSLASFCEFGGGAHTCNICRRRTRVGRNGGIETSTGRAPVIEKATRFRAITAQQARAGPPSTQNDAVGHAHGMPNLPPCSPAFARRCDSPLAHSFQTLSSAQTRISLRKLSVVDWACARRRKPDRKTPSKRSAWLACLAIVARGAPKLFTPRSRAV